MPNDFDAIAALNVAAYAEFAPSLSPGSWETMEKNLQNIAERARSAEFMVCRTAGEVVGSVAYCPAGKGGEEKVSGVDCPRSETQQGSGITLLPSPLIEGNGNRSLNSFMHRTEGRRVRRLLDGM